MKLRKAWVARLLLAAMIGAAIWGVFDPGFKGEGFRVRQDQVVHALCVYLLTLLAIPAFPRFRPVAIGGFILGVGVLLEYLQGQGIVPGAWQQADMIADAIGVAAVLLPLTVSYGSSRSMR